MKTKHKIISKMSLRPGFAIAFVVAVAVFGMTGGKDHAAIHNNHPGF